MEHPAALNDDFNLSTAESTTVLELAEMIWQKINGADKPFRYTSDAAFEYDVQTRVPDVSTRPSGCWASRPTTTLDEMLDEVIPWIEQRHRGRHDLTHQRPLAHLRGQA